MALDPTTGWEIPDPTPLARAVRFTKPPTLEEIVQRTIRGALSRHAAEQGHESFDEANDFNVDEDGHEFRSDHEFSEQDEEDLRIWKESQRVKRKNPPAAAPAVAGPPVAAPAPAPVAAAPAAPPPSPS